ncbi:MAG: NusG domain II-containing protein [Tissierellia bacterium]|nr:NusG domain II-containing protein [Tissierellia bacterium]
MKLTKGDKILIVFLAIFSLFIAYFFMKMGSQTTGKYVSIMVNGEEIKQIDFTKDMIGKTYAIETRFGRNVIEFGDESVWVIEASCPDKLDIKQGVIDKPGQVLVCLPNRLIVEIKARDIDQDDIIDNLNY